MRMRKKKHRDERLENCASYIIENIEEYKNDIKKVFENDKPLHIEIGCGKGKFIEELASLNPDINYIAVEKNLDVLVLAAEKASRANLSNLKFVAGDACIFDEFETKTKCERIYLNFSDPWKKSGQKKRRLTHERFLNVYKKLLVEKGEVHFKTDNTKLFEFSLNSFCDYGLKVKNITFDLHNSKFEGNIMTEYETRFAKEGKPIYRCEAVFN
ncbi:MAG: tRNA (guanosine(46)-N7)-methyltransferase TrmB [Ruminococcaceae bacterium]|nr:tRNA (guanosine(46)-N7)-methyltransferase TrmB [Oscillospiraceae bacterium]